MVTKLGMKDGYRVEDPIVTEMTEKIRKELDSVDWTMIPNMQKWLGGPNVKITAGTINASEVDEDA